MKGFSFQGSATEKDQKSTDKGKRFASIFSAISNVKKLSKNKVITVH